MDFKNPYLLAFYSGILCILSFPPFDISFLIWFALIPILYITFISDWKTVFLSGLLFGMIFYLGTLFWITTIFSSFGLLLIFILCLIPAIALTLMNYLRKIDRSIIFGPMIVWTAFEFFRSEIWPLKFTWMNLGYSQHDVLLILQFASIFGQYGLTMLIVLVNSLMVYVLIDKRSKYGTISIIAIFALVIGFGAVHLDSYEPDIDVALIQDESSELSIYENIIAPIDADFILLPEYSIPEYIDEDPDILDRIREMTSSKDSYLIAGAKDRAEEGYYNTAYVFDPAGEIIGRYYKMNPIQFFADGIQGTEYVVHETRYGTIGVLICYDMDYPYVARRLVKNGADLLFIPTYDAMRWSWIQHLQHSAMTSMRAVENGKYIARTATSGTSQIIDPNGRITSSIGIGKSGAIVGKVKIIEKDTFYTRAGWTLPWIAIIATLFLFIKRVTIKKKSKRKS